MNNLYKKFALLLSVSLFGVVGCSSSERVIVTEGGDERERMTEESKKQQQQDPGLSSNEYSDEDWFYDYYDVEEDAYVKDKKSGSSYYQED